MATACPGDLAGLRDRALLLLAATGLGRSALVGLDVEQKDWIDATDSRFGPVFRKVDRWGNIEHRRLGTDAIRRILTRRTRGAPSPRRNCMTRAAVNAAATADALLAWPQSRAGATAIPGKSEGGSDEAASAQVPDGGSGVPATPLATVKMPA